MFSGTTTARMWLIRSRSIFSERQSFRTISSCTGSWHPENRSYNKHKTLLFANAVVPKRLYANTFCKHTTSLADLHNSSLFLPNLGSGFPAITPCHQRYFSELPNKEKLAAQTEINEKHREVTSKEFITEDLKQVRDKVKGKMEEIIERENIWTIPNLLCVSRIVIAPFLCSMVLHGSDSTALALFIFAGFTDLLDGAIARVFPSQASKIGSFLDPLADKILVACLFLTLTYVEAIPVLLTAAIVGRDVLIVAGASYVRYKSIPPPMTMTRYFDATHATVQLSPTFISKVNTAIQLGLITATLAAPVFNFEGHYLLESLWYLTAVTTFSSGMSYIYSKNTYKILSKKTS